MTQSSSQPNPHKFSSAGSLNQSYTSSSPAESVSKEPSANYSVERSVSQHATPELVHVSEEGLTSESVQAKEFDVVLPDRQTPSLKQRFLDLPIRNKQFLGLGLSETISVIGLVGVGAVLIVDGSQNQLKNQAKSELVVTSINYNIKVDQMGFGFRGQSDNAAVISAAKATANSKPLKSDLKEQVRQVLRNEVAARNIEYATLVDKNSKIIVSANADRAGETFNPGDLVSQALKEGEQVKANEIVSWAELAKEAPPLPNGFKDRDALIRYTVTPIKDPDKDNQVIGALISGDVVNNKPTIVEKTVEAFGGGYSAIYLRQSDGKFALATALDQGKATELKQAKPNIALPDSALLDAAVAAKGKPVTQRVQIGDQAYTAAAKTLSNSKGQPVAILLRGTPETAFNQLIQSHLLLQLIVAAVVIAINIGLSILIGRSIAEPLKKLQQTTKRVAEGDLQARSEVTSKDEVGQLANDFNAMADRLETSHKQVREKETQLAQEIEEAKQARQLAEEATRAAEVLVQEQSQLRETLQQRALELLEEVDPISHGDLTVEARVTDDEIGTIADSYNATVDSLRTIVRQVQQAASQVSAATSSNDAYIRSLADEAARQATEIATAMETIQTMAAAARKVSVSAEQAEVVAQQAAETVEVGEAAMNRTVDGIQAIRATVAQTAKKVKHLGESSQKISTVVELIGNFAEQTKMLALNASIEAALAGEDGRGFAVVAEEVRALARQSAEATEEIRKLVVGIQAETNEVVAAMEAGTEQVVTGTRLVDETRQSLNQITLASTQISELVKEIAQAAVVQSHASETVTQTMQDVATTVRKTSTDASQVSASLEYLQQVAQTLQANVDQFKV